MNTSDFEFELPEELIAQRPAPVRDKCRMLVMDRATGHLQDKIFSDLLDFAQPGDLFVANETRVLPARLLGHKRESGGACEVLLLRPLVGEAPVNSKEATWEALVKPGKRLKPGSGAIVDFCDSAGVVVLSAEVIDWAQGVGVGESNAPQGVGGGESTAPRGGRVVRLSTPLASLDEALHAVGRTPLPPYIHDYAGDEELYQTVYSRRESSAAAPTAGLHFTPQLIDALVAKGARWETVELQVGLDTFRIVDEEDPKAHAMHKEFYSVPKATAQAIAQTKAAGGRVIAVGTTSVRTLESAWCSETGAVEPCENASTSLFLLPGSDFHVVDGLITNFHVPRSTLLMLVSAFSSRDNVMAAYNHAIKERYRFFSFGDAMLIL